MIGAQSGLIGMDARGSEPMAGDESEGPMTQTSLEAKSVSLDPQTRLRGSDDTDLFGGEVCVRL